MHRFRFIGFVSAFVLITAQAVWAQTFVVETGRPAELAVAPVSGAVYYWEFFCEMHGSKIDDWLQCSESEVRFINYVNKQPSVTVMFNNEGTYFFKVTIIGEEGCMNYKIGKIEVSDDPGNEKRVVARNDYYEIGCEMFVGNVLENDSFTSERVSVYLLSMPANGYFSMDETGRFYFEAPENFAGTDSLRYMICDDTHYLECDIATVYFDINTLECSDLFSLDDFFVPEGFSPNHDGINDYFKIAGIERYPDAKLSVYTRHGHKVFEKERYGNRNHWPSDDEAWWWGNTENAQGRTLQKVPAGNYIYILSLGKNNVRRGTVMVSY